MSLEERGWETNRMTREKHVIVTAKCLLQSEVILWTTCYDERIDYAVALDGTLKSDLTNKQLIAQQIHSIALKLTIYSLKRDGLW